jgi:vacuolar iron transporter family protein
MKKTNTRGILRDSILGGQDGLVNVLGIILAVATATSDIKIVILAGLAATFAESISMAAVAYTSSKAASDYYKGEFQKSMKEIHASPIRFRKKIKQIYSSEGFRGKLLNDMVTQITSSKKLWSETLLREKLHLSQHEYSEPIKSAWVVGFAAIVGSLIPLAPFFFVPVANGIILAIVFSTIALFTTGAIKARITTGHWVREGTEIAIIGIVAALTGYAIGVLLGAALF